VEGGFSPLPHGGLDVVERESKDSGTKYSQGPISKDLFLWLDPHLLKFPKPPENSNTSWVSSLQNMSLGNHFIFKPTVGLSHFRLALSLYSEAKQFWDCIYYIKTKLKDFYVYV
jgi:hypothetical protein